MYSVEGYQTIIVGGSRGIGQALAYGFTQANAKVTILDINRPESEGDFNFIQCDLEDEDSIKSALIEYHNDNYENGYQNF